MTKETGLGCSKERKTMAQAMTEVDLPYHPKFRGARYPKGLLTDFRRLQYRALATYVEKHSLRVRPDATQSELAVAVASHFLAMKVSVNDEWGCGVLLLLSLLRW